MFWRSAQVLHSSHSAVHQVEPFQRYHSYELSSWIEACLVIHQLLEQLPRCTPVSTPLKPLPFNVAYQHSDHFSPLSHLPTSITHPRRLNKLIQLVYRLFKFFCIRLARSHVRFLCSCPIVVKLTDPILHHRSESTYLPLPQLPRLSELVYPAHSLHCVLLLPEPCLFYPPTLA